MTVLIVPVGIFAQPQLSTTVETVKTTETAGTISEFGPERIVVRTETNTTPMTYTSTKTTTYVDETGQPVAMETVKSGLPVTVYYTQDGNRMVADKVMVRKITTTRTQ
ncbi:MAG: hypothetical protein ACD_75C00196G0015 [uncultured bacterium]|nr:MAG: hypothetical protein ACD_75C00196G0015 [uncultured bacterium]